MVSMEIYLYVNVFGGHGVCRMLVGGSVMTT